MKKNNTNPTPRIENECLNWTCGEISLKYEVKERPTIVMRNTCEAYPFIEKNIGMDIVQVQEHFFAFYLDQAANLIGFKTISTGGTNNVTVNIKLILSIGLILNAVNIIVAHNHPSNNLEPSWADITLTENLIKAAKICGMSIADHLIIGNYGFTSMGAEKIVNFN